MNHLYHSYHIPKCLTSYCTGPCSAMSIAALITVTRKLKQPKCPPTNEWIVKIWYIYTMGYKYRRVKVAVRMAEKSWESHY